ncbi:MAG: methionine biosynthesis protein MetW [Alphaproteobacteria bacterium]
MNNHSLEAKLFHLNYAIITDFIEEHSKVLDLGCGDGSLIKMLIDEKQARARGVDISQENVIKCIEKALSVTQGNIDDGLLEFADKSYDYVILNQTLQSVRKPDFVIEEMLRVGKKVVVSFPNFGYWKIRFYLFFKGKMPKSKILPFSWYDTPNIHLLTIKDFFDFIKGNNIKNLNSIYMTKGKKYKSLLVKKTANFLAEEVIFVISK